MPCVDDENDLHKDAGMAMYAAGRDLPIFQTTTEKCRAPPRSPRTCWWLNIRQRHRYSTVT